jgi:transcriptional regulator with XRE-family HTH domain
MSRRNLAGPQVRRLRCQRGWSQEQLAAKLQLEGLDISRSSVAKIENGHQAIFDYEILIFCRLFRVSQDALHPALDPLAPDFRQKILAFLDPQ